MNLKTFLLMLGCIAGLACAAQETSPAKAPPRLRVQGNRLVTEQGRAVWLQGLNVPSLEWSATGDNVLKSVQIGIGEWRAKVIRLSLSQDRWFGKGSYQDDQGKAYRALVDQVVGYCAEHGAYVVLDLHWSDAGVWGKSETISKSEGSKD